MQATKTPATPTQGRTMRRVLEGSFTRGQIIGGLIALAVLIALPFIYNKDNLTAWNMKAIFVEPPVLIGTMADAAQYVILAIGLNIVVGFAGLLDLGYAAFFAFGAYTYAFLASGHLAQLTGGKIQIHLSFWLVLFIAAAVSAFFGALLGSPTLRLRGDYLAIVTLGFGEIVPAVFLNLGNIKIGDTSINLTGGVDGISGVDKPGIATFGLGSGICRNLKMNPNPLTGGCRLNNLNPEPYYFLYIGIVVLLVIAVSNMRSSRLGRAWMAIREDEIAAAAMGIDTVKTKLLAFASGAALAGVAGVMFGAKLSLVGPNSFDFNTSVFILCMVILGGIGNIYGVIVGALILYLTQTIFLINLPNALNKLGTDNKIEFLAKTDWSGLKFMIYGIILVVLMIVRPEGLIPSARRKAELRGETGEPRALVAGAAGRGSDEAERANPVATAERESLYDVQTEEQPTERNDR